MSEEPPTSSNADETVGCLVICAGVPGICWLATLFVDLSFLELMGVAGLAALAGFAVLTISPSKEQEIGTQRGATKVVTRVISRQHRLLGDLLSKDARIDAFASELPTSKSAHTEKRLNSLQHLHSEVFANFTYRTDEEQFGVGDDWRSYAEQLEHGQTFADDCDAFALTCCELILRRNIASPSDVLFIICDNGGCHAVCGVLVGDGVLILDNMYDHIYSPDQKNCIVWYAATTMERIGEWREFKPAPQNGSVQGTDIRP